MRGGHGRVNQAGIDFCRWPSTELAGAGITCGRGEHVAGGGGATRIWSSPQGLSAPQPAVGWTTAAVLVMAIVGCKEASTLEGVPRSCPVTVPGDGAFRPESETPDGPDPGFKAVPYGRPELWTMLDASGEVWRELPAGAEGSLTQMLYFWSENHVSGDGTEILLFGENLDESPDAIRARGGGGSDPSRGDYLSVVFDIPEPGCWRISAVYRATGIDYVVWVEGD